MKSMLASQLLLARKKPVTLNEVKDLTQAG